MQEYIIPMTFNFDIKFEIKADNYFGALRKVLEETAKGPESKMIAEAMDRIWKEHIIPKAEMAKDEIEKQAGLK